MKPTLSLIAVVFTLAMVLPFNTEAQTYTISSNTNWSALSPSPDWCSGCTFNISSGVTLTMDKNVGCTNCTFNGGTIVQTTGFSYSGGTFNNDNVTISQATNFYTGTGGATFSNGTVNFNVAVTCQACSFSSETANVNIPAGSTMTLQASGGYNVSSFTNSTLTMSSGSTLYANSQMSLTNSSITLNSDVLKSDVGAFTLSHSQLYFNGSSNMTPTIGPLALTNTSTIFVGDGTNASTAFLNMGSVAANTLQIDATSLVKVANGNNYYFNYNTYQYTNAVGTTTSVPTATNTISCNHGATTGYDNACATNYVYGCATLSSGAVGCTVLATTDMNLTATIIGAGQVALGFSDAETSAADRYLIQRSTGGNDWTTIGSVAAGGYSSGEYRFTDADAPAGTVDYRIARIDQNSNTLYSAISSVIIAGSEGQIGIHPNPATGGTFYITIPYTGETVVNIFTITGQLLLHTSLKGQTQYPIHLPSAASSLNAVVVQTIGQTGTRTFTVLVR